MTTPQGRPELPKTYDPTTVEGPTYQRWLDAGVFTADPASDRPRFSMALPPPNVTGSLHIGHALDHTYQDGLARLHRIVGFTSFTGMLAHIWLITWGYAAGDLLAAPGELWDLTVGAIKIATLMAQVPVTPHKDARRPCFSGSPASRTGRSGARGGTCSTSSNATISRLRCGW